jgi:uncharacterized membrane protein
VLVEADGGWQLAYLLEALHDGWVAVFVPQSPTPMSGNVIYAEAARVQTLDLSMSEAMQLVKRLGIGSAEKLRGANLAASIQS